MIPFFADIHIHLLYDVDDGPKTSEQMQKLFEQAYKDGTRLFCVTPHFHFGLFGDNIQRTRENFLKLRKFAAKMYPDAVIVLGNELRYSPSAVEWLDREDCNTLNRTKYVLVDFRSDETEQTIRNALYSLLNAGYQPVLAHAERYRELNRNWDLYNELKYKGVTIQVDADSILGNWDRLAKKTGLQLLKRRIADVVCSDAHDTVDRPPVLKQAFLLVEKRFGTDYAEHLFYTNAAQIISKNEEFKKSHEK